MATGGINTIYGGSGESGSSMYSASGISGNVNPPGLTGVYGPATGPVYCIQAYGGYNTTQSFDTVHRLSETVIGRYDVTGSVEVLMDVRLFNNKIGIGKDASNLNISTPTSAYYDDSNNMLTTDSFSISASEFVYDISTNGNTNCIISVGVLSTIYSDFSNYVATYFGMPNLPSTGATNPNEYGFATLFSNTPNFNPNGGVFDKNAFVNLINAGVTTTNGGGTIGRMGTDGSGANITALAGTVTISGITALLRNAVDVNPFGNRNPSTGTTASDPYDRSNYGVTDGFFADDLFFIPSNGINITLTLTIDQEAFGNPANNVGSGFLSGSTVSANSYSQALAAGTTYPAQDISGVYDTSFNSNTRTNANGASNTTFVSNTTSSSTLISRNVTAPLLIRLANYTYNLTNSPFANPTY
jgi:hypothetical protein